MPQQELNLLQFTPGGMAQSGTGSAAVVGREPTDTDSRGVTPNDVPDHLLGNAFAPNCLRPAYASEQAAFGNPCATSPITESRLHPFGNRHCSHMLPFSKEVHNGPMLVALLNVLYLKLGNFTSPKTATQQ